MPQQGRDGDSGSLGITGNMDPSACSERTLQSHRFRRHVRVLQTSSRIEQHYAVFLFQKSSAQKVIVGRRGRSALRRKENTLIPRPFFQGSQNLRVGQGESHSS